MAKKKFETKEFSSSLKEGLKYPWKKASRLWNILWFLIPIFGWFALVGYLIRITKELVVGQRKELPAFGSFWNNFKVGFIAFIFLIPTYIVLMLISFVPIVGQVLNALIGIFLLPWLVINFYVKGKFKALWDIGGAFNAVFNHLGEYVWAYLKTIVYVVIYGILSFILIGIPPYVFGSVYFLTDFYRKYKK